MDITSINLNLLAYFVAISDSGSLSGAAQSLHLSQPALSHALQRLRSELADPLFVRTSHGLAPTPRATELLPRVRAVLDAATHLYTHQQSLESIERSFSIAITTYFELRVLPQLLAELNRAAPKVSLQTRALVGEFPNLELERGTIDLAIAAYFDNMPPGFRLTKLGKDPFVCVTRPKHPFLKSAQTLDDYLSHKHVVIDVPPGALQPIDLLVLQPRGLKRTIGAFLGNFLTAPWIVAQSDMLLTCPRSLAEHYAAMFKLVIAPLPAKVPPIETKMVWHERNHHDVLNQFVRRTIAEISKGGLS